MMGHAAIQAAERARDLMAGAVAERICVPTDRLTFADRRVFDVEEPSRGVSFAEAGQIAEAGHGTLGSTGSYRPPDSAAKYKGGGVGPSPAYSYSARVVQLQAQPRTGRLQAGKNWIAPDL